MTVIDHKPTMHVRVLYRPGESHTPGYPWARRCEGCGERIGYWRHLSECVTDANEHAENCAAVRYFALVARMETLRDQLIREARAAERFDHPRYAGGLRDAAEDLDELIREAAV